MSISVVLPAHNAASFLLPTLQSVETALTARDELIIVVDSCSDRTVDVADNWKSSLVAGGAPRVSIIECSVGSVALARNEGIKKCTCDWVGFVDHDDRVDPAIYRRLLAEGSFSQSDVVRCGLVKDFGNNQAYEYPNYPPEYYAFFGMFVWNSVFKRDLIFANDVSFRPGYGEDYEFNLEIAFALKRQTFISLPMYIWKIHEGNQHKKRTADDFCLRVAGIFERHKDKLARWPNACSAFAKWIKVYREYLMSSLEKSDVMMAIEKHNVDFISKSLADFAPRSRF